MSMHSICLSAGTSCTTSALGDCSPPTAGWPEFQLRWVPTCLTTDLGRAQHKVACWDEGMALALTCWQALPRLPALPGRLGAAAAGGVPFEA